jgi:hypothetical protein
VLCEKLLFFFLQRIFISKSVCCMCQHWRGHFVREIRISVTCGRWCDPGNLLQIRGTANTNLLTVPRITEKLYFVKMINIGSSASSPWWVPQVCHIDECMLHFEEHVNNFDQSRLFVIHDQPRFFLLTLGYRKQFCLLWLPRAVDLRYPAHRYHAVPSPGFKPTTLWLRVRHPNHSATALHSSSCWLI